MTDYATAVARVLAARISDSRTTTAKGTVVAVSSDGSVTFTIGDLGTRKGVYVGDAPRVGDVVTYLDEGRGIPIVLGSTGRVPVPRYPLFYQGAVANGTSTTGAVVISQPNIMTAPQAMWMVVNVTVEQGANAAPNSPQFTIYDETATNNITYSGGALVGGVHRLRNYETDSGKSFTMVGKKSYSAGQTVGFHTYYSVDGSNLYLTHAAVVNFYPVS